MADGPYVNPGDAIGSRNTRRATRKAVKKYYGLLRPEDVERMAARAESPGVNIAHAFGLNPGDIPESAPDPEEAIRRNRRKMLATARRRQGRMSTIMTGGDGEYGL